MTAEQREGRVSGPTRRHWEKVAQVGIADDPPARLIVHRACKVDGGVRVVDVWESREAAEAFDRDRLMLAFAAAGITSEMLARRPQPERTETFDVRRGR